MSESLTARVGDRLIGVYLGALNASASKIAVLLMESGLSCNKQKLHKVGYFRELLATNQEIDEGLRSLLRPCRETVVRLGKTESALV